MMMGAEELLKDMLCRANIQEKPSYRRSEVCAILGCSERTYWSLLDRYELNPQTGAPFRPDCLNSYMFRRERRVTFEELAAYLSRNNTYHRKNAINPSQMMMFE